MQGGGGSDRLCQLCYIAPFCIAARRATQHSPSYAGVTFHGSTQCTFHGTDLESGQTVRTQKWLPSTDHSSSPQVSWSGCQAHTACKGGVSVTSDTFGLAASKARGTLCSGPHCALLAKASDCKRHSFPWRALASSLARQPWSKHLQWAKVHTKGLKICWAGLPPDGGPWGLRVCWWAHSHAAPSRTSSTLHNLASTAGGEQHTRSQEVQTADRGHVALPQAGFPAIQCNTALSRSCPSRARDNAV